MSKSNARVHVLIEKFTPYGRSMARDNAKAARGSGAKVLPSFELKRQHDFSGVGRSIYSEGPSIRCNSFYSDFKCSFAQRKRNGKHLNMNCTDRYGHGDGNSES